jgi:hypothetical protein
MSALGHAKRNMPQDIATGDEIGAKAGAFAWWAAPDVNRGCWKDGEHIATAFERWCERYRAGLLDEKGQEKPVKVDDGTIGVDVEFTMDEMDDPNPESSAEIADMVLTELFQEDGRFAEYEIMIDRAHELPKSGPGHTHRIGGAIRVKAPDGESDEQVLAMVAQIAGNGFEVECKLVE